MKIVVLLLVILVNCAHPVPSTQAGNNYGIIGGQTATDGEFPYQASIYYCYRFPMPPGIDCYQLCGGTVISPKWIVTAASCYKTAFNIELGVGIGYTDASKIVHSTYYDLYPINQTIVHDDYLAGEQPSNDIRLYQLRATLNFTQLIQPIKLPKQNSNFTGEAVATGWGYIKNQNKNFLQYQTFNMPDGEKCADLANAVNLQNFNVTTNVCTEHPKPDQGTCNIDTGGPLVQNGTLVGISSWNFTRCGVTGVPSVFTRVSNYVDWITDRVTEPLIFN